MMSPIEEYISSSKKYDWRTPDELYLLLDEIFHFDIDIAAEEWNTKCEEYFTPEINALIQEWVTKTYWWLNPPWGNQYKEDTGKNLEDWLNYAMVQYKLGRQGVMLVPENLTSVYMNKAINEVPYIVVPQGRVRFVDPNRDKPSQPTKGTIILLYVKKLNKKKIKKLSKIGLVYSLLKPK